MKRDDTTLTRVAEEVRRRLPAFISDVAPSIDDPDLLCVRVYGVPRAAFPEVREAIAQVQETLFPDYDFALIPMIKDEEVTNLHYSGTGKKNPGEGSSTRRQQRKIDASNIYWSYTDAWRSAVLPALEIAQNLERQASAIHSALTKPYAAFEAQVKQSQALLSGLISPARIAALGSPIDLESWSSIRAFDGLRSMQESWYAQSKALSAEGQAFEGVALRASDQIREMLSSMPQDFASVLLALEDPEPPPAHAGIPDSLDLRRAA